MKWHILFSMKNKKNVSKCHLLKFLPSMQSVNEYSSSFYLIYKLHSPSLSCKIAFTIFPLSIILLRYTHTPARTHPHTHTLTYTKCLLQFCLVL